MNDSAQQYNTVLKLPKWAPPSWVFAPVWAVLYTLLGLSLAYLVFVIVNDTSLWWLLIPFAVNVVFNAVYTYLQFGVKKYWLAFADVVAVVVSLAVAIGCVVMTATTSSFPLLWWVAAANVPYLLWGCFALVLQLHVALWNA